MERENQANTTMDEDRQNGADEQAQFSNGEGSSHDQGQVISSSPNQTAAEAVAAAAEESIQEPFTVGDQVIINGRGALVTSVTPLRVLMKADIDVHPTDFTGPEEVIGPDVIVILASTNDVVKRPRIVLYGVASARYIHLFTLTL